MEIRRPAAQVHKPIQFRSVAVSDHYKEALVDLQRQQVLSPRRILLVFREFNGTRDLIESVY